MKFDLRLPIGLLFTLYGAILAIFGLLTPEAMYARSFGINMNLAWGIVLALFGGAMLALALASRRKGTPQ
jgi:hypothetical protein